MNTTGEITVEIRLENSKTIHVTYEYSSRSADAEARAFFYREEECASLTSGSNIYEDIQLWFASNFFLEMTDIDKFANDKEQSKQLKNLQNFSIVESIYIYSGLFGDWFGMEEIVTEYNYKTAEYKHF